MIRFQSSGIITSIVDKQALAFIVAAGITDVTQIYALHTLVRDLKNYGLWTVMDAIYPMIGGTATTHKFNLKDPQDTDAAFRLTFAGGWTHTSTGALPNGTTGYADTHLNPKTVIGSSSGIPSHFSFYSRTNSSGLKCVLGAWESSGNYIEILPSTTFYFDYPDGNRVSTANSNSTGYYVAYNNSTNGKDMFRNNVALFNAAHVNGIFTNANYQLSYWGDPTFFRYSNHELAMVTIGHDVWDSTMASNLYTAVNKFQTTLGRNV